MFGVALVIFREVLEMSLIVSVVLAATGGHPSRNRWIGLGFLGGIAGAGLVAIFTDSISDAAEGVGQELFNSAILFTAALLIGWTIMWMRKHAREMAQHLKKLGTAVVEGELPFYSLAIVIALAVLREGSEIVLFTYGAMISGTTSVTGVLTGGAIGITAGALIGVLLYYGLLKISTKNLFKVTGWLLMFLVAGLSSQGARYLSAAGYFTDFSDMIWDTSAILSESGVIGQTLGVLFGYSERPLEIQVIFYLATLGVLIIIMKIMDFKERGRMSTKNAAALILAGAVAFSASPAYATKKVYSPSVEGGELEFEWRGNYDFDHNSSKDGKQKDKLAVGYGVTDRWFTEVYVELEQEPDKDFKATAIEWENIYQLTEQGEYWLDAGIYAELKAPLEDGKSPKVELKLLLEKQMDEFVHTVNIVLEEEFGKHANGGLEPVIAWRSKYRLNPYFEPGIEYHASFGRFNQDKDFEDQDHQAGPAFYGKIGSIKYDVGYLFGLSKAAPDGELKWILEYEMKF